MTHLWDRCLREIRGLVGNSKFSIWFKELIFLRVSQRRVFLSVKDKTTKEVLENHYINIIESAVQKYFGKKYRVVIVLEEAQLLSLPFSEKKLSGLNPDYTFDEFVVGDSNRFAFAAAKFVAEAPSKKFNPLFIYGGVGLGKTHLLHAIGNYINEKYPNMKVLYISSEDFINQMVASVRKGKMEQFRKKFRKIDVLLIDDIQFIAGKERTQIEFFHTFNAVKDAGGQIVLTSDKPPSEIKLLADRLKSRFEWGLLADIQPPDFETRYLILKKKAQREALDIDDETLMKIATQFKGNIRQLEGLILKLKAQKDILSSEREPFSQAKTPKPLKPEQVIDVVCDVMQLSREEIMGNSRARKLSKARQLAMFLMRNHLGMSFKNIALFFGRKDHTTVMHACRRIQKLLDADRELMNLLSLIDEKLSDATLRA